MHNISISTSGEIFVGTHSSGYGVKQTPEGTEVYVLDPGRRYQRLYWVSDGDAREVDDVLETDDVNEVLVVAQTAACAMAAARAYDQGQIAVDNAIWRGHTIAAVTAPELPAIELPHARYALSCDAPESGVPGAAQFAADFLAALAS